MKKSPIGIKAKTVSFLLCLLISLPATLHAQQDPLYAQYLFNPLVINPAYAGLNNDFNAAIGYRTQWTGVEGQPETFNASAHTSLLNNIAGAGLLIMTDRIGNFTTTEVNGSFAYKIELKRTTISFGMQAGVQNFNTDNGSLNLFDNTDIVFQGGERGTRVNIGAGMILKRDRLFLGLSVPRLLPSRYEVSGKSYELYNQHFYLMGAYFQPINERISLKPSILLRTVQGAPASVDVAMNVNINTAYTAGIFTRNFGTYGFLLQTVLKDQYRFGYVFEIPTARSLGSQFTTHELMLGIRLSVLKFHGRSFSNF